MCGIWALLSKSGIKSEDFGKLYTSFMKIKHRGPDYSSFDLVTSNALLGFHRLAIMDLTADGNQPFHHVRPDGSCVYCICNGEIYDYKKIKEEYNITTKSHSDCEVIIPLYEKVGVDKMVRLLGSEFVFIIIDINKEGKVKFSVGRDPIGVRPLFYGVNDESICFSSEMKGLSDIYDKVYVFSPGTYMICEDGKLEEYSVTRYYNYEYKICDNVSNIEEIYAEIRKRFRNCVEKRLMTDQPFGALLSGGLDSSSICGEIKKIKPDITFPVFTVAFKNGSTDLPYAKECAEYLGLQQYVIETDEHEALQSINETIYCIESYDITSVRASVMNRLACKGAQKAGIYVLFGGDGSDELFSGYRYNHFAPSAGAAREDCIRLVNQEHKFDGLRSDRSAAYYSLEVRLPFCDPELVDYIFSLSPELTLPQNGLEKALFRDAFANENMIPESIRKRDKEALSDAVSKHTRSWYQIIQEYIETLVTDEEFELNKNKYKHNPPPTKEAYYYRKKFVEFFGDSDEKANVIPYFWMPKWTNSKDPSARTLKLNK